MDQLLTNLVKSVGTRRAIEFGTQQGHSAVLIAKGATGTVYTYDTFSEAYNQPPFKPTHANYEKALKTTGNYDIWVRKADVFKIKPVSVDTLHIDICNHYDNVKPLLEAWQSKIKKMIILEGGVYNKWQKKYGFNPFNTILTEMFMRDWNHVVIRGEGGYAMTVLTRK